MKLQRLLSLLRQAIDQYQMIENGDHIAIGISGGKDSLTLLYGLSQLQKFYPKQFHPVCHYCRYGLRYYEFRAYKGPLRRF